MSIFGQRKAQLTSSIDATPAGLQGFFLVNSFLKDNSKQILLIRCKYYKHSREPRREKAMGKRNSKMSSRRPLIQLICIIHTHSK